MNPLPTVGHVVVGFVPTPEGQAAVDAAITEASARGAALIVINASRGGAVTDPNLADADTVADVVARASDAGVMVDVRQPQGSDPVEQLLVVADDPAVALLVIGLPRRSPVGKLFLGSAAQRLLLGAACPVLAVKTS